MPPHGGAVASYNSAVAPYNSAVAPYSSAVASYSSAAGGGPYRYLLPVREACEAARLYEHVLSHVPYVPSESVT